MDRQQHLANELAQAYRLGRESFRGANRQTHRNPYVTDPFREQWLAGRTDEQFGWSPLKIDDSDKTIERLSKKHKYD